MGKFRVFAQKIEDIVSEKVKEYETARARVIDLEDTYKKLNEYSVYGVPRETKAKAELTKIQLENERANFRKVQEKMYMIDDAVNGVRQEFLQAINQEFSAKPEDVDLQTMALLNSGMLDERDYTEMLNNAPNRTMKRIIADRFGKWIDEDGKGLNMVKANTLKRIVTNAKSDESTQYKYAFEMVADAAHGVAKNPSIYAHWERMTGNIIKNL